ncbi:MAG: acetolactate synthase small subunit [Kiritimatiellia bacterium]|jgi:acetolactate synthase-1/3 small subunit
MKHILSVVVENRPGVLARVVGLISGRGYNIDSLNVAPTQDTTTSRITMVVPGDDHVLEQVTKQLNKLVDVIKVNDLTGERYLGRELMLVKVAAGVKNRTPVLELVTLFNARVVGVQSKSLTIRMVGISEDVDNLLDLLRPYGILELSRSGVIVLARQD